MDAAFDVFAERGIAGTSLSEVAAAAGLTKGAVYSNFASKDDLVLALIEEHASRRIEAGLDRFAHATDNESGLALVADVLVEEMHTDAAAHRLLAEYFAMAHRDPVRRDALRDRRREIRETLARALTLIAERDGLALPLPPDELAVIFLALSNGLAVESDIDPTGVADDLLGRVLGLVFGDAVTRSPRPHRANR